MQALPKRFVRTVEATFEGGADWLARLPSLIAAYEQRWQISVRAPFPNLSYNFVAPAVCADGTPAVLKLGVPCPELTTEIAALQLYDDVVSVAVLAADDEGGALLLEHIQPGTPLTALDDDARATAIAADVMRCLWRPVPPAHPFPDLERWTRALRAIPAEFVGSSGPLPARLVDKAQRLCAELIDSATETVLLHGDLHHDNILRATRQPWLMIDPKGLVGDPAFEVGALLHNPAPWLLAQPQLPHVLTRRIDILSARLGLPRERLVSWGIANAVLSACWSLEDGQSEWVQVMVHVAEALERA